MRAPRLGELLLQEGLIDENQLRRALEVQRRTGRMLGEILVNLGYITHDQLADALAKQLGLPRLRLDELEVEPGPACHADSELCRRHLVFPIKQDDDTVLVATADPLNVEALDAVQRLFPGKKVKFGVVSKPEIERLAQLHPGIVECVRGLIEQVEGQQDPVADASKPATARGPAAKLVDSLLSRAIADRATDIHLEPRISNTVVSFRIDGVLHDFMSLPVNTHRAVVARIKVMSNLDLSLSYLPQDGHFHFEAGGSAVDVRVSILPLATGEKVVMRLLPVSQRLLTLDELGISEQTLGRLRELLARPQGIILVTGPTGSGKTTTLYAALQHIMSLGRKNITTIEDPVERVIDGLSQVQVHEKRGLTFLTALRAILRQDPDVIMIGETRDAETARTAFQAALTGHLVLTTLHTNDAASAVTRLIDLGLEPYLVAAALTGSFAQRLLRRVCPSCARRQPIGPRHFQMLRRLVGAEAEIPGQEMVGQGCRACAGTGYRGRVAVAELIEVDRGMAELISQGGTEEQIRRAAVAAGTETMQQAALKLIASGVTNTAEVLRVLAPERAVAGLGARKAA